MTNLPGMETIIEITYLIATALFILSLKWLSSPTTARRGVFAVNWACSWRLPERCCTGHRGIQMDCNRPGAGNDYRRAARRSGDDRRATADSIEPRVGALCVTLVGTAEFYLRTPDVPRFMMGVLSLKLSSDR